MSDKSTSFIIETEIPPNFMGNLLDFIRQKYLLPQKQRFTNVSKNRVNNDSTLTFTALDSAGKQTLNVEIMGGMPIKVNIKTLDEMVTEAKIEEVKQDVIIAVELFEEKVRESTLYFAWREGEEIVPEELHGKEKKSINRLFLETQILLFVLFISLGMFLFLIVGWLAPIILLAIQLIFVFYSNKFIARTADWRITGSNPVIHLLEYHLPLKEHEEFRQI